jgi:hypothetical protein
MHTNVSLQPLRLHHLACHLHHNDRAQGVVRAVHHARLEPDHVADLHRLSELDLVNLCSSTTSISRLQCGAANQLFNGTSTNLTGLPANV